MKELDEKEEKSKTICIRKAVVKHSYQDTSHLPDLSPGFKFRYHISGLTTAYLYIVQWKGNNEKVSN